jgi:hypothetical protein
MFAAAFLVYQDRRYRELDQRPATDGELTGPDSASEAGAMTAKPCDPIAIAREEGR